MGWTDVTALVRGTDLQLLEDGRLLVRTGEGRRHLVAVKEDGKDALVLRARVASESRLEAVQDPVLWAWQRNRAMRLAGFRVDSRGGLVAESWIPRAGLTAEEFEVYVKTLAREADRFEFLLTGEDFE